jgi:hypothetical protein
VVIGGVQKGTWKKGGTVESGWLWLGSSTVEEGPIVEALAHNIPTPTP